MKRWDFLLFYAEKSTEFVIRWPLERVEAESK